MKIIIKFKKGRQYNNHCKSYKIMLSQNKEEFKLNSNNNKNKKLIQNS